MDIVFGLLGTLLAVAVVGLAHVCARLGGPRS
jgi:hypothetical protein